VFISALALGATTSLTQTERELADVVIVGAGIAGLAQPGDK
jgi:ribulose 1,5-bisphosphate synthetase/thiazole synthase